MRRILEQSVRVRTAIKFILYRRLPPRKENQLYLFHNVSVAARSEHAILDHASDNVPLHTTIHELILYLTWLADHIKPSVVRLILAIIYVSSVNNPSLLI